MQDVYVEAISFSVTFQHILAIALYGLSRVCLNSILFATKRTVKAKRGNIAAETFFFYQNCFLCAQNAESFATEAQSF